MWLPFVCALGGLSTARLASAAESDGSVTKREGQFLFGLGYGWGRFEDINPLRFGLLLRMGYTAANSVYVGVTGEAYSGERREYALAHTDVYMVAVGVEVGYDLRLAERWALRIALLNGLGALAASECAQMSPPPSQKVCSATEYTWRYEIGPSASLMYLWEQWSFFTELRQTSFLSSSEVIFSGTLAAGFGLHW